LRFKTPFDLSEVQQVDCAALGVIIHQRGADPRYVPLEQTELAAPLVIRSSARKLERRTNMRILLKLEELGIFLFAVYLFSVLSVDWWLFPLLLLTPDLSMVGYLAGPSVGAFTYNFIHHRVVALGLYSAGMLLQLPSLSVVGVILLAHASLDRVLGYGLKYRDAFAHTHLGTIGHPASEQRIG